MNSAAPAGRVGHTGCRQLGHPQLRWCEREVVGGGGFGARQLRSGAVGPQWCAHRREGLQGLAQSCAGKLLLALTTLQLAEQQLGTGPFEWHRQSIVLGHRVLRPVVPRLVKLTRAELAAFNWAFVNVGRICTPLCRGGFQRSLQHRDRCGG
jgi:hypothetical protein